MAVGWFRLLVPALSSHTVGARALACVAAMTTTALFIPRDVEA